MKFKPEPGHIAAVAGGLSAVGLAAAVILSSAASADTETEACTPSRVALMAADGSTVDVHTCVYPADSEPPEPSDPPVGPGPSETPTTSPTDPPSTGSP